MKASLPFSVDRTSALSLIAQVSEGFRRAIESGVYRPGDILPNMEEISAAAGVSMMVTRAAIRRLAAAGLVEPRRRTGILVLDSGRLHWRGHVLVVTSELSDNYLVATVAAKLRVALGKAGYLVTQTTVLLDADKKPDYSALDLALREPTALVVALTARWGIPARIAASGVPFACYGSVSKAEFPSLVGCFDLDVGPALDDFAAHCRAAGVRRVMAVEKPGVRHLDCRAAVMAAGLAYEEWEIPSLEGPGAIRNVQRATLNAFAARLAEGRAWLPDVLFFNDDFRAQAALIALEHAGVRVPDDVAAVSWATVGGSPCHWLEITRIELNVEDCGDLFARHVLAYLSGGTFPRQGVRARPAYRLGDTFPRARAPRMANSPAPLAHQPQNVV